MKLTIFFVLAFVTAALCGTMDPSTIQDHRRIDDLRNFFTIYFKQYNLSQPNELVACFDDKTADIFFRVLVEFQKLLVDINERRPLLIHLEWIKIYALFRPLKDANECVTSTKDYADLLEALDIEDASPDYLNVIRYIYFQARFEDLLEDFEPLVDSIESKDHRAAGIAYYNLTEHMLSTVKKEGIFFLGNQAFGNGFAVRLKLNDPSDSLECWDNKTSKYYYELLWGLSEAVSNGSWYESPINTHFFWKETGADLFKKIPNKVWECLAESNDNQQLIGKINLNIYEDGFDETLLRYINDNRLSYFAAMKGLKHSIERHNPYHAGYVYAHFIKQVAKWYNRRDKQLDEVASF